MLIPGLTFLLVAGIILGTYWAFVMRPEQATETALRRRLGRRSPSAERRTRWSASGSG